MHPSFTMTPEEQEAAAEEILRKIPAVAGGHCGGPLTAKDLHWTEGCTEYGTSFSWVYVECPVCGGVVLERSSWVTCEDVLEAAEALSEEA